MFTGAASFCAAVCNGAFTHYKREEEATMESGKLDEELSRMSQIASGSPGSQSCSATSRSPSTNEREGSEIARQIVRAMLHRQIKIFFVMHMYDLAHSRASNPAASQGCPRAAQDRAGDSAQCRSHAVPLRQPRRQG